MPDTTVTSHHWQTLPCGARVLLRPDSSNQVVSGVCFLPLGSSIESENEAGLVSLASRLLLRGTKHWSNAELAELIDSMGISLSVSTTEDHSVGKIICTDDCLEESLRLWAEVMLHPSFEPEEIEKERQNTLAAIRQSEDDKLSVTIHRFYRELYGNRGYGLPSVGLKESVGELTREQIIDLHEAQTDPSRFTIALVGNFDAEKVLAVLAGLFPPRQEAESGVANDLPIPPQPARRVSFSRDCEQAYLVAGYPACPITHPDFAATRLLNAVLGEGMSSRLFTVLRDEQGLAYATGSSYSAMKQGGQLFGYIGTKPESLDVAREGMIAEFERLKTEKIPQEELDRARNYVIGKFLIDHQTNYKRAFYPAFYRIAGLGSEMDDQFPELLRSVTPGQILEIANKTFTEPTIAELVPTNDAEEKE